MDTYTEERVPLYAGALKLEGILAYPEKRKPKRSVLLLAPHPHFGGNMDNNVIRHLARRLAEHNSVTLRFNYRGIGESEINLSEGQSRYDYFEQMETQRRYNALLPDAQAACRFLAALPGAPAPMIAIGYSFGAFLAAMLAHETAIDRIAAISPPLDRVPADLFAGLHQPILFLGGDRDFTFSRQTLEQCAQKNTAPCKILPDCDHFFRKREEELFQLLLDWIED